MNEKTTITSEVFQFQQSSWVRYDFPDVGKLEVIIENNLLVRFNEFLPQRDLRLHRFSRVEPDGLVEVIQFLDVLREDPSVGSDGSDAALLSSKFIHQNGNA